MLFLSFLPEYYIFLCVTIIFYDLLLEKDCSLGWTLFWKRFYWTQVSTSCFSSKSENWGIIRKTFSKYRPPYFDMTLPSFFVRRFYSTEPRSGSLPCHHQQSKTFYAYSKNLIKQSRPSSQKSQMRRITYANEWIDFFQFHWLSCKNAHFKAKSHQEEVVNAACKWNQKTSGAKQIFCFIYTSFLYTWTLRSLR